MEPERFDALVRSLATTSRRAVLRLLAGGVTGSMVTQLGQEPAGAVCTAAGLSCDTDGQCCSGQCKQDIGCGGFPVCCVGLKQPCTEFPECQCCKGRCDHSEPRRCCQVDGGRCRRTSQCCRDTGSICKGRKCCRDLGGPCAADSTCCSGHCSAEDRCCQPLGKSCTAFGQCCSGFCSQGKCVTFLPLP